MSKENRRQNLGHGERSFEWHTALGLSRAIPRRSIRTIYILLTFVVSNRLSPARRERTQWLMVTSVPPVFRKTRTKPTEVQKSSAPYSAKVIAPHQRFPMRAAVLTSPQDVSRHPLRITEVEKPSLQPGQVLLKVRACGVCRTDLHIVEGELAPQREGIIPGHQIVGAVVEESTSEFPAGTRVGFPGSGYDGNQAAVFSAFTSGLARRGSQPHCAALFGPANRAKCTEAGVGRDAVFDSGRGTAASASLYFLFLTPLLAS